MAQQFFDSVYKYTDPVRYFKANDPYYYEVDNIPLKQLQENCNFLKDQVGQLVESKDSALNRSSFSELKPFVYEVDNVVYVSPGRYTARINDAYLKQPLQILEQVAGYNVGEYNKYKYRTTGSITLANILQKFRSNLAQDALGANGLFERTFTYAMKDLDFASQYLPSGTTPGMTWQTFTKQWPNVFGRSIMYNYGSEPSVSSAIESSVYNSDFIGQANIGFGLLPSLESEFIKKWRGIARTSIVDIPETLSLQVPAFNSSDFFYKDASGNLISLAASSSQRIDLLFIYSKPIDSPSTTISKFVNNQPVTITAPALGLLKGAGIGLNFNNRVPPGPGESPTGSPGRYSAYLKVTDSDGNPIMLPSLGDQNAASMGFSGVKGSFPSPDDLLNIAPLLSENLESTNLALIGQSILPVAYIVVKNDAQINIQGNPILLTEDVIDIRPFFRTTELAYNERAGIAAATPQISIANPVASEGYVDFVAKNLSDRINVLGGTTSNLLDTFPRIVKTGYILGGARTGPESTLIDYLRQNNPAGTFDNNSIIDALRGQFAYPSTRSISLSPDWDLAEWAQRPSFPTRGTRACDWINYSIGRTGTSRTKYGYSLADASGTADTRAKEFSTYPSWDNGTPGSYYSMFYVKKTFIVTKPSWAVDVNIDARFFNCCPLSNSGRGMGRNGYLEDAGKFSNIWTSKRRISATQLEITIFVSWAVDVHQATGTNGNTLYLPPYYRDDYWRYTGFSVLTSFISNQKDTSMADEILANNSITLGDGSDAYGSFIGTALYPSVVFDVIAVPGNAGVDVNYGATSQINLA